MRALNLPDVIETASATQNRAQFRGGGNDPVADRFQIGLAIAFLTRLQRHFNRERNLTFGHPLPCEAVKQARSGDILLIRTLDDADEIATRHIGGNKEGEIAGYSLERG